VNRDFCLVFEIKGISILLKVCILGVLTVVLVGFLAAMVTTVLIINPDWNFHVRQNILFDSLDYHNVDWSFRGFRIAESS